MELGNAIRNCRREIGLSQREVAVRSSISANALCNIETDKSMPSKATLKKICNAMGVPIGYVLFCSIGDEDIPEKNRILFRTLSKPIKDALLSEYHSGSSVAGGGKLDDVHKEMVTNINGNGV